MKSYFQFSVFFRRWWWRWWSVLQRSTSRCFNSNSNCKWMSLSLSLWLLVERRFWRSRSSAATYGSEFTAARTATEQIIDLRTALRYMGVPLGQSVMFGDSQAVIISGTTPHSQIKKRHDILSYHGVRSAVAANIFSFHHIPGDINPADILSKHWGFQQVKR